MELPWLQENLGARPKLKPAEPMGPGLQYSYLRATSMREDVDTFHIAPRSGHLGSRRQQVQAESKRVSRVAMMSQDRVKETDELTTDAKAFSGIS